MGLATTVLRVVTGATVTGHGLQKLTGSFGGEGTEAVGRTFSQLGFEPGKPYAVATGATETVGGLLMATGLGTPFACAMVSGVMASAISKVHYKDGLWTSDRGLDFNLMVMASAFAIAGSGGGVLSLDGLRGKRRRGFVWAVAQLVVGVGAAVAVLTFAGRPARSTGEVPSVGEPGQQPQTNGDAQSTVDLSDQGRAKERSGSGA